MKKSTFLMALLCLSLTVFANGGKGGVSFGNPSKGCEGGGICKATHTSTNLTQAGMDFNEDTGILLVAIEKSDMDEGLFNYKRGVLHFRQEAPLIIDDGQLLKMFKVHDPLVIPKGNYSVSETRSQYIIHFEAR